MKGDESFESDQYEFSDTDSGNGETKPLKSNNEKEEESENKNIGLIKSISQVLETILEDNKRLMNYSEIVKKQSLNVFSSRIVPKISMEEYLIRIQNYTNIEKNTLIVGLIYIDRFCKISGLTLTYYNINRILFISILISIKYNEDKFYDNKYYSEIAGIKLKELNTLEYNYIHMIHFLLYVKNETHKKYKLYLENFK